MIQIHCRGVNPPEKHINLSSYYPIINGTAGFYGHGPVLLTILHRAYLNSIPLRGGGGGVTFNGVKHEIHSTGDTVDTALAALTPGIIHQYLA